MKRAFLFLLVLLLGLCGYLWYEKGGSRFLLRAKELVFRKSSPAKPTKGLGKIQEASIRPAAYKYEDSISSISSPEASRRIQAWEELTKAYLKGGRSYRDLVLPALRIYVNTYILSRRFPNDPREAERVNVRPGDSLVKIAKKYGTTVEAIKRLNGLSSDVIRPGMTLKVLNQPVAIFIDKSDFRLWVTYGGKFLLEMPCGIGAENRTPSGRFVIAERIKDPEWYRPDGRVVPAGDPENELGSRWLGFRDTPRYTGLGIHEARNPQDVGKACSQGCIRLRTEDILLLFDITPVGTVVTIRD